MRVNLLLCLREALSARAVAKASSSPGFTFFGDANNDSSYEKEVKSNANNKIGNIKIFLESFFSKDTHVTQ